MSVVVFGAERRLVSTEARSDNAVTKKLEDLFVSCLGPATDGGFAAEEYRRGWFPAWDSVSHMDLVARIEDEFDVSLEVDDIVGLDSYQKAVRILGRCGVAGLD
jgi:hypothetical protein